jgi:hypothetical protein
MSIIRSPSVIWPSIFPKIPTDSWLFSQLGIRILFVTISPVIANKFTFMCPLDANDIEVRAGILLFASPFVLTSLLQSLLKTAGVDLAGLVGGT